MDAIQCRREIHVSHVIFSIWLSSRFDFEITAVKFHDNTERPTAQMVIYVVARNPFMRTARNVFIVNLAISDLMLCLITMPLTLVEILYVTWQFGEFGEVRRTTDQKNVVFYQEITSISVRFCDKAW